MATLRFNGTYKELQDKLKPLTQHKAWHVLGSNIKSKRFEHPDGAVLIFTPSDGSLSFEGPQDARKVLEAQVADLLGSSCLEIVATPTPGPPLISDFP